MTTFIFFNEKQDIRLKFAAKNFKAACEIFALKTLSSIPDSYLKENCFSDLILVRTENNPIIKTYWLVCHEGLLIQCKCMDKKPPKIKSAVKSIAAAEELLDYNPSHYTWTLGENFLTVVYYDKQLVKFSIDGVQYMYIEVPLKTIISHIVEENFDLNIGFHVEED